MTEHLTILPAIRRAWARWRACVLLVAGMAAVASAAADGSPTARQGVLALPAAPAGVLELGGEWGFTWQRFVDPGWTSQPATAFGKVPGSWNELTAGGKPPGTDGWGSYTLQVDCPAGQQYALAVAGQRTAARVFVNGTLVASQGEPGTSPETTRPAVHNRVPLSQQFACPLRITVHLADFSHRAGGFVRALPLGTPDQLAALREQRLVQDSVLLGAYLLASIVTVIFFVARRKDPSALLFGLFLIAMGVYSDLTGERVLLRLFGTEVPWEAFLRVEYLSWFAAMALFGLLVRSLFPRDIHRMALRVLLALTALGALVVIALPAALYSHLSLAGQLVSVALAIYVTWAMAVAARRGQAGASVLLVGMAVVVVAILLDMVFYAEGPSRRLTPIGIMVFVLSPSVVLARRLARALNVEELRALEQRVRGDLLVRSTKAGIYDWDVTTGQVVYSERLKEMLGFPADADTAGWPVFHEFIHPEDRAAVRASFVEELRNCKVASGEMRHEPREEFRLLRRDGSHIWVKPEAISLTGSDCRTLRYICSFIDITDRRAMEEGLKASRDQVLSQATQLQRQNAALEDNARLREEVERMSRHDLKTPLNSIIGVTRLLRDDPRMPADHLELLGVTERAGYRMLEMVNLSLGLFKMETGAYDFRPQAVNLAEVVDRVLVDMQSHAEANRVSVRLARAGHAPVYARAEELLCYSIVANLLKNAVEATPPGGAVTLSLEAGDPAQLRIHNPGSVPAAVAERFFDKYVTAGKSGGTGLGTYSARLMARVQEGDLTMASSEIAGTTLTLALKALTADALPAPLPAGAIPGLPQTLAAADFQPRRILVVDDDEYNRLILRRYLPSPPFTVDTAVNGQAAIEAVARDRPDILLIDMEMPVMGGVEAVAWVRRREALEQRSPCIIIVLSSNDDAASIRRCLDAGANRFITKPVTREALLEALRELDPGIALAPVAQAQPPSRIDTLPAPGDVVQVDSELADRIPEFLESRRQLVEAMEQALASGDREQLRGLAHRAGGGLALYGFQWAAWQSRQIETGAENGDPHELGQHVERLRDHLRTVQVR
ncbi:response regulator [Caenimonas sedimenti]|uniref:histidine kinase n=1 Tax=Caenimonas sedimenti TaxID=2596921 RepID=A0A562ZGW3_9BURK|nr:response regulator [Caenimonas sedimenti]TWO66962.1 response regulator [Caenimonas sedimenti]